MIRRFLNLPLAIGEELSLKDDDYNYIARVLRSREGDPIVLFNGKGGEYHGIITEISKRYLTVKIKKYNPVNRSSSVKIHLLQSLAKGEKMDFILQKSTELGVSEITPLTTERSIIHLKAEQVDKRIERWRHIITSACEQCGLNIPPKLNPPVSLDGWLANIHPSEHNLVLTLAPNALSSLGQFLDDVVAADPQFFSEDHEKSDRSLTIIIGPEGGLSEREIELLDRHGAKNVTLGERILRTETAALAVIASIHSSIGDWSVDRLRAPF